MNEVVKPFKDDLAITPTTLSLESFLMKIVSTKQTCGDTYIKQLLSTTQRIIKCSAQLQSEFEYQHTLCEANDKKLRKLHDTAD